jgi:hypothetical protein
LFKGKEFVGMQSRVTEFLQSEERRVKKVESLIALLRDPEMTDVVNKLFGEAPTMPVSPNGNGHHHTVPRGITAAIRASGPRLPKPFTIHDVVQLLTADGFQFSRTPIDMVRDTLYFVVREPESKFKVIESGRGGRLSQYEYVG